MLSRPALKSPGSAYKGGSSRLERGGARREARFTGLGDVSATIHRRADLADDSHCCVMGLFPLTHRFLVQDSKCSRRGAVAANERIVQQ